MPDNDNKGEGSSARTAPLQQAVGFEDDMDLMSVAGEVQVWLDAGWCFLASMRVEGPDVAAGNVVIFDGAKVPLPDRLAFLQSRDRLPSPPLDDDDNAPT